MKLFSLRIIACVFAISALFHIILALSKPNGWTFYENILIIKYTEIAFSIFAISYLFLDIISEAEKLNKQAVVSYDPLV